MDRGHLGFRQINTDEPDRVPGHSTAGEYHLNGAKVSEMDDNQLAEIRNKEIGFIFQTFNFLPRSNALAKRRVATRLPWRAGR